MSELPPSWIWTTLGEVTLPDVRQGGPQGQIFRYIDISSVDTATKRVEAARWLPVAEAPSRARQNVELGDVLVSLTRPNLNAVAFITPDLSGSIVSTGFHVLRSAEIHPPYLYFYVQSREFVETLAAKVQGVVYPAVRPRDVTTIPFPLPPFAEQRRIVAEIEKHFTRLSAAELSILNAERKTRVLLRNVISPLEPSESEVSELSQLPKSWHWKRADEVCHSITKGTTPAKENLASRGEVPYIKVNNLSFTGALNFEDNPTFVPVWVHLRELARSVVVPGDVLMNIVGPPLGKVSLVPATYPQWNINQAVACFRPISGLLPEFLAIVLRSQFSLRWLLSMTKATVGQVNLTLQTCRAIPIPVPPESEQREIVDRVESVTSQVEANRKLITRTRSGLNQVRRSILASAFAGKLVPQDPNDEPASVLLERIRARREAPRPVARRDRTGKTARNVSRLSHGNP